MAPLYLFFHLAKTGGTTFVGHLYNHLKVDEELFDLGPHGEDYRKLNNRPPLEERTLEERQHMKIVAGHLVYWHTQDLFPDREIRNILFLREPIKRVISHYTYDSTQEPESFSHWYSRWIPNQMTVYLKEHLEESDIDGVLEKLKVFWHIGLQEELDKSLTQLYSELGVPTEYVNRRVSGEKYENNTESGYDAGRTFKAKYQPTPRELAMIEYDHQLDIMLYKHLRDSLVDFRYYPSN